MQWQQWYYDKTKPILRSKCLNTSEMYEQHEFVIRDHLLFCYHSSDFDNISILASSNNDFKVTFIETPLNSKEHLPFGKGKQTLSLDVLDD